MLSNVIYETLSSLEGRPERDTTISKEDILNIRIDVGVCKDSLEFINKMGDTNEISQLDKARLIVGF
jgi:hypothetical protein